MTEGAHQDLIDDMHEFDKQILEGFRDLAAAGWNFSYVGTPKESPNLFHEMWLDVTVQPDHVVQT